MPMRTPFVGGNWKMNASLASAAALTERLIGSLADLDIQAAIFPPFPYLLRIRGMLAQADAPIALGAQDAYFQRDGAYTGEVSLAMLADCGVTHVLTGHSERRHVIGESDELVGKKTQAVLDAGLTCVLCIGETLGQREAGDTDAVNERQARAALAAVTPDHFERLIIAYEPVWAIGTGRTATPDDAQAAHASIRALVADMFDQPIADATRIIYGGSVNAKNAAELFAQPDIDGGLIGGASLDADNFTVICRAAAR